MKMKVEQSKSNIMNLIFVLLAVVKRFSALPQTLSLFETVSIAFLSAVFKSSVGWFAHSFVRLFVVSYVHCVHRCSRRWCCRCLTFSFFGDLIIIAGLDTIVWDNDPHRTRTQNVRENVKDTKKIHTHESLSALFSLSLDFNDGIRLRNTIKSFRTISFYYYHFTYTVHSLFCCVARSPFLIRTVCWW